LKILGALGFSHKVCISDEETAADYRDSDGHIDVLVQIKGFEGRRRA
jgi:hypothetical protein